MVTKGIITSIDFNGNTCQVRIPLFETAGNDPITGTAIVSNTPGSYNGYKVGDVVLVAFEDGKMQNPVIVGKLYLGAAKEKQDPRGTINVETTTASKSASLPADAVLTANVDSNVPNTNTPFGSLASIANNLNSLNTDVNQLDRFTRNQFNSVITDVNDQGEQLRSEIKQTAENIEANVVHTHKDGSQKGLGWDLTTDGWKINAQDTVTDENGETKVKDINIVTITREGMSIAGDLKLNGYPKNIVVRYAQNGSDTKYPNLYNFKPDSFPGTEIDKTWYYNKYIKIIEADKEKYILISSENIDDYTITPGETVAYIYNLEEINPEWKTETPARVDGQYIWQWTHTESFSFDGDSWNEKDDDKVVCITGAKGEKGEPATTYWAKLSTAVHTGKNQKSDIEITPYTKTGSSPEAIDITAYFKYSLDNGANWNSKNWTLLQDNKIVISAGSIKAHDIIVKLAHAYTDPNDSTKRIYNEYETETITYSPLNTPIIDLTNDTDVIKYKPDGTNITGSVVSTAQVYLGGSPEAASYTWSCSPKNGADFTVTNEEPQKITVTGISSSSDKAILTCTATTTNFKDKNGNKVKISKDFVVSKEVVVASYWLSFSPVHTGNLQQTDIEVKALAKIGNDSESKDTNAYFRYSWDNGTSWIHKDWTKPTDATLIIPKADIQNNNLRIQATHDKNGIPYEDETITYSPLNTPVLDLTNDSASLPYNGDTKIGSDVAKSTGKLWLNGKEFSGNYTLTWEAIDGSCATAQNGNTVSVNELKATTAIARCTVTNIDGYKDTILTKDFIISKSLKGSDGTPGKDGAPGKDGDSVYTISIDNDFDSVPADVNGNVSSDYSWESETKHNVRVYYGKEAQDFTVMDQSGTAPSTGLCLKYKLTKVTLGNTPSVSNKVATAWINDLSADTGNVLYTLYIDGAETGINGKFSATKIKSPAPTYTISIDNDFATIPTSTVNAKIYRKASQKFKPADKGYIRETVAVAGAAKKLPGMRLSAVNNKTNLNTALLWKPDEVIKITSDITKSYVEDITKHNVAVYCNDNVETITADNFIVKLDSDGLDADMDTTQNYLVCELGGFDSTGVRATDFPGMNPVVNNNVVTNYITALSALGNSSESKNAYIQYTYYVEGKPVATAKFEVTRHTGPTTYYLSSNVSTIKVNKDATITPDTVTCTAYSLDTSTNTNTKFTNGTWKYKWDTEPSLNEQSTSLGLSIDTAGVIANKYKQLYIELYLGNQLWDRETIDVIADGENAVDYKILVDNGQIKRDPNNHTEDTSSITFSFYKLNGSTRSNFNGAHFNYYINGDGPTPGQCDSDTNTFTVNADSNPSISSITKNIKVELLDRQNGTVLESETIDVVADGTDGQPGVYIKEVKQWYILKASSFPQPGQTPEQTPESIKPEDNAEPTYNPAPTSTTLDEWMSTPPEAVNGYNIWTCYGSIFSDDVPNDSNNRHIKYSVPVKDAAYALAQGKTTNYYSPTEPVNKIKIGDCWFDTGYVKMTTNPENKAGYLGKFIISADGNISVNQDEHDADRYIPVESKSSSTKLIKITPANIDTLIINKTIVVGTTYAYETGNLKQCSGFNKNTKKAIWKDIAGELVTNKLTANYINAMDITAKKINVNDTDGNTLFKANGIAGEEDSNQVTIGGWKAKKDRLYSGTGAKTVSLQSELTNDSFVECIVANGNQYIDTDLYIDYNTDIVEITYQPTTYDQNGMIFGQWDVETASQAALYLYKDGKTIGFYIPFDGEQKALNTYINYTNLSKQTIKIQKESSSNQLTIYVNGRATSFETYTKSLPVATITSYIASGRTHNGTANWGFKGKIYNCKIWRNGSLIRNYAPYYKANTQTYGLFDLCNNTFTSSGSGYKFDGEYSSIYLGSEESRTAPFSVSNTGQVRASDVSLEGHIISDGGRIGGFTISGSSLTSGVRGENDFVAIASDSPIECKVANAFAKYKLIIGNTFGVVEDGKINISNGDFTGSATLNGGKLSNIESIECNNLKIGPINITPTTFGEQTTSVEDVTFEITEGSASYIGGSTIYYVTITASKKLAKALQLPYKISYATYEGKYDSSGYNNKVQKIFFNSAITFPANTLKYEVSVIADSYGQYGLWDFVDVVVSTLGKKGDSVGDIVKEWDAAKNSFTCKANVSSETESWGLQFSQNLIPGTTDNVKASIGTSSQTWKELHCDTAYATYFYGASDRRLKENIKDYIPKNSILDLPVVEFDFKDSGKHQIGCIAQDLQKLFPELVEARDDGYLTIEENKLVYLLLLEIKKLNAKIDNLSATKESKGDRN